jgi:hypothetical protein
MVRVVNITRLENVRLMTDHSVLAIEICFGEIEGDCKDEHVREGISQLSAPSFKIGPVYRGS